MAMAGCKHRPRGEMTLPHRSHDLTSKDQENILPRQVLLPDGSVVAMPETSAARFALVYKTLSHDMTMEPPAWSIAVLQYDAVLSEGKPLIGGSGEMGSSQEGLGQDFEAYSHMSPNERHIAEATDPSMSRQKRSPQREGEARQSEQGPHGHGSDIGHQGDSVPTKQREAPKGYAPAQDLLARMTLEGDGVAQDSAKAFNLALDAARQGHSQAQVLVATLYTLGHGTKRDTEQAFFWLREAARAGEAEAMAMLADMYRQGEGVAKDEAEAFLWTRKASQAGVTRAYLWLGLHYYYGIGTPRDGALAAVLLRPFAELGDTESQRCVAVLAYEGRGIKQDLATAVKYFTMAAASGDKEANLYLGVMAYKGQGLAQDMAQSRVFFLAGAKQGEARCMSLLASMLELGEGGHVDKVAAYAWYNLAGQHGDRAIMSFLLALHDELSIDDLTAAQALMLALQMEIPSASSWDGGRH